MALDNLAEVLLHRHRQRCVDLSGEAGWGQSRRFTAKDLDKLRADFGARVALATVEQKFGWYTLPAILDSLDESIVRVAHAYRNRVYHADHHNPTLLPVLARAYLGAVGRAFVRSQPVNVGSSITPSATDLATFGYKPRPDSAFDGYFVPAEAAQTIVAHLLSALDVDLAEARRDLQLDLQERVAWIRAMVGSLLRDGMPPDRFAFAILWTEFWEKHGADDELAALDERRLAVMRVATDDTGRQDRRAFEEAETAYTERIRHLQEGFVPSIDLSELDRYVRLADRLSSARSLGALFTRYHKLDESLEGIEDVLAGVAIGWDRWVQDESDRLRGK